MARFVQAFLFVVGFILSAPLLRAGEREQREYSVFIDGREAGSTTIDIDAQDNGTTVVTTRASIKVQRLIVLYSLTFDTSECWKDGKLVSLTSQAKENGKATNITMAAEGNQLRARINGQERMLPGDVWTSTFWKLPDAKFHNNQLALFEIDTGKDYKGQLQFVGTEQLTILNKLMPCFHFRYTGGATPTDVWFDSQHRLVRQEFVEMGHKTIGQLIQVKR